MFSWESTANSSPWCTSKRFVNKVNVSRVCHHLSSAANRNKLETFLRSCVIQSFGPRKQKKNRSKPDGKMHSYGFLNFPSIDHTTFHFYFVGGRATNRFRFTASVHSLLFRRSDSVLASISHHRPLRLSRRASSWIHLRLETCHRLDDNWKHRDH